MTDQALRTALLHMTLTAVLREGSVPEPLRTEAEKVLAGCGSHWRTIDSAPRQLRVLVWDGHHQVDFAHYDIGKRDWLTGIARGLPFRPGYWSPVPELVAPEDHGHYIGVPVADDPDRQE